VFVITNAKGYELYLLSQSDDNAEAVDHEEALKPLRANEGFIHSVMLHPECNRILYSIDYKGTGCRLSSPYSISMTDVYDNENAQTITTLLDVLIKKTVDLGKNTFIGLTNEGILAILWLQNDGTIACALQKHASKFKDIAVDNSVKTAKGFKPHIACLTVKGELLVGHLLAFKQPTIFSIKLLSNYEDVEKLFYDKGECGVLYNSTERGIQYSYFVTLPDNFEYLFCKKELQEKFK
jgi:hypothetical protein